MYRPQEYAGKGYGSCGWVHMKSFTSGLSRVLDYSAGLESRSVVTAMKDSEIRGLFVCSSCFELLDQNEGDFHFKILI